MATRHQAPRRRLCVLLVGIEPAMQLALTERMRAEGHQVVCVPDADQLTALAARAQIDVVVCHPGAPNLHRCAIAHRIGRSNGHGDALLVGSVSRKSDTPLRAIASEHVVAAVGVMATDTAGGPRELAQWGDPACADSREAVIVGESPAVHELRAKVRMFAASNASVLITGESGTGKELVARALHRFSNRASFPFVAVNCAAIPETLLESEFFGHERGAFTGAVSRRVGRFVAAQHGTLFLDEVVELPLGAQAKLLRALESGEIESLGASKTQSIDVRVVSATHRSVKDRVEQGLLREDLYYRLKVLHLHVAPLRERGRDVALLAEHFLSAYSAVQPPPPLTARAWDALAAYPFPGNVRELAHAIEHACVLADGAPVDVSHLPAEIVPSWAQGAVERDRVCALASAVQEFERQYLLHALRLAGGQRTRAAEWLRISRKNLWEKIRRHHIEPDEFQGTVAGADKAKAATRALRVPPHHLTG